MSDIEQQLIAEAKRLLEAGTVKCVIGYRQAREPYRATPLFVERPEQADRLIWNATCTPNLARYLSEAPRPAAIVAKGCDARSIVQLIQEKQIPRDEVYIIGVPCHGMVDLARMEAGNPFRWTAIEGLEPGASEVVIRTSDREFRQPREAVLLEACRTCRYPTPALHDVLLGAEVPARGGDGEYARVSEIEGMTVAERRAYWLEQFSHCIRCQACRRACPGCYCPECVLERMAPRMVHAANSPEENLLYQAIRSWHLTGRCVDCGECERACPMNLPLREMNRKLEKEVRALFGQEAGLDPEAKPLFGVFADTDPEPEAHKS